MLTYIVIGLTAGAVYGLAGVGLVLTYKTSGIFNFAHGALASVSAYAFYFLNVQHGVSWPIAAAICLFVLSPIMAVLLERLACALTGSSLAVQVASTVGLVLIVQASFGIIYGTTEERSVPQFLPTNTFTIAGTVTSVDRVIVIAVATVATAALWIFFRKARLGMAMRAVVASPDLLDLSGRSPTTTRRWAWVIGTMLASASGILLAPTVTLTGSTLTLLVVQAFGAAAIGGFTSLPITFIGGIVVGVASSVATKYLTSGLLGGVPASLPFIILFIVLLVFPKRRLATSSATQPRRQPTWSTPAPIQLAGGLVVLGVLLLVPSFAGVHLTDWTVGLTYIILFLSLGLLVRTSGQVSLGHIAFMAIGVTAFSRLAVDHHWPWALALLGAGLVAVPIGALLAIPAIRLSGLYLALATFGFAVMLSQVFYTSDLMFGEDGLGVDVPRPSWASLDSEKPFYYLVLVLTLVTVLVSVGLNRGRLGRLLRALADSPLALATNGTSVRVTRIVVFCLSAFLAATAGALGGMAATTAGGESYQPMTSLTLLTLVMIVAGGTPWYAIQAGLFLVVVPSYVTSPDVNNYLQILFGVAAVLFALSRSESRGTDPRLREFLDRHFRRRRPPTESDVASPKLSGAPPALGRAVGGIAVADLSVRFGGVVAVNGISLEAPPGRITALIGPNGAGKTTTINACAGLIRPSQGTIALGDRAANRLSPALRARLGLGRTFQRAELCDSMTVRENVELGAEAQHASANPLAHFFASPSSRKDVAAVAIQAIAACGLAALAGKTVGSLSSGQRRLVEFARCLAGRYDVLLLDEPSSGLDREETVEFGRLLRTAVDLNGLSVLLVEHDMSLVTTVCDYVYVLDFGSLLFEGTPAEAIGSPVVQAAYLGTSEMIEVSSPSPEPLVSAEAADVLDGAAR